MTQISMRALPTAARRPVWDAITTHQPQLGALLQEATLREIIATFDGHLILDTNHLHPEVIAVIRHHAGHLV